MEKKPDFLDFLAQVFLLYGITVLIMNLFCLLFGEAAREYSTIFSMGSKGIGIPTMMQFLLAIGLTVTLRFIFTTDLLIRKMSLRARIVLLFASVFVMILAFSFLFGWFPADDPMAWLMFILSFAVSCTISTLIAAVREKCENQKLKKALEKMKEEL